MRKLTEIRRETYGRDSRAINRHCDRWFRDENGNLYVLSRTLDGCPPFFEAYGPFMKSHQGSLPRLLVKNEEYWGDGWSWRRAERAFCQQLNAVIAHRQSANKEVQPCN